MNSKQEIKCMVTREISGVDVHCAQCAVYAALECSAVGTRSSTFTVSAANAMCASCGHMQHYRV